MQQDQKPPTPLPPDALGGERYLQNRFEGQAQIAAKSAVRSVVMIAIIAVVGVFAFIGTIVYMVLTN
jgi:hypothetical protein